MLFGAGSGKGDDDKTESGESVGEAALGKAVTTAGLAGGDGCESTYRSHFGEDFLAELVLLYLPNKLRLKLDRDLSTIGVLRV